MKYEVNPVNKLRVVVLISCRIKRKHDSNNATVYMKMYQYYNVQDALVLVHYYEHTKRFLTAEPFRNKILLL